MEFERDELSRENDELQAEVVGLEETVEKLKTTHFQESEVYEQQLFTLQEGLKRGKKERI